MWRNNVSEALKARLEEVMRQFSSPRIFYIVYTNTMFAMEQIP